MSRELTAAISLAREQLARGQTVRFVARGQSMWPTILDGDRLTLSPALGGARIGEVHFLPTDDFGVTHRVVARLGPYCCLKGDAAATTDGWHHRDRLAARVTEIDRDGRPVQIRTGPGAVLGAWAQGAVRSLARVVRRR